MKSDNILAFVGGAILGAVAAILLAPDSGENTRAKIKAKTDETYEDIKEKVRQGKEKFQKKSVPETDAAAE